MRLGRLANAARRRALPRALWWLAVAGLWHRRHGAAECFARLRVAGAGGGAPPDPAAMRWALEMKHTSTRKGKNASLLGSPITRPPSTTTATPASGCRTVLL